jgi:hypothetical protein
MAIEAEERAFLCLGKNYVPLPIGEVSDIQREVLFGRILVMEGQGRRAAVVTTGRASATQGTNKVLLSMHTAGFLGAVVPV